MSMLTTAGETAGRLEVPLHLPMQAAPIDRTPSAAALQSGAGVEAAFSFSDILSGAGKVASALAPAVGGLLGI